MIATGAVTMPDQDARDPGADDLSAADRLISSLRVALDELVALDERRQVRLVGDVEEDGQAADDEPDDVELPDRQDAAARRRSGSRPAAGPDRGRRR